jgi:hypothetical protein
MANKSSLKIAVLVIGLVSLAGCQILSDGYDQAQAAVETEAVTEDYQTEQVPAIQDADILQGWEYLRSLQEPIYLPDGTLTSGRELAQFLVQQQIPVVWDHDDICHGTSCSQQFCSLDGGECSYEDGTPGANPIYLNTGIREQGSGVIERLARELGHEAFHRRQHFGSGMITQIEEYTAFYLDTQLVSADYPDFNGIDPQDPAQLAGWFTSHRMSGYLKFDPYPGVKGQAVQVEQGVQAAESVILE